MQSYFTESVNFFAGLSPVELIEKYGSPLYVYNEEILRDRCKSLKNLIKYPKFKVNYSIKANSNFTILKILKEEGLNADAVSPGEIQLLLEAGYSSDQILFISGNISKSEMEYAISKSILISADSISQLELFGYLNPGGNVCIRLNPGIGTGHHKKVVTGGKNTKFGIDMDLIPEIKQIASNYNLKIIGVNHHIGSLFMEPELYLKSAESLLNAAEQFSEIELVDFGGGFGIPYKKQEGQSYLNLISLGESLDELLDKWTKKTSLFPTILIEPGRFIVAESGIVLGSVTTLKQNSDRKFIGTDIGFNVLARPVMYGSHHDIELYRKGTLLKNLESFKYTVVGNICESGDIIAEYRDLPSPQEGDLIGIMDAGAYGYSMASNYNCRLRPAEVLICSDGTDKHIRKRDTFNDLMSGFNF